MLLERLMNSTTKRLPANVTLHHLYRALHMDGNKESPCFYAVPRLQKQANRIQCYTLQKTLAHKKLALRVLAQHSPSH